VSAWMSVYVIIWTGDGDNDWIMHRGVCVDDHEVEDRCGRVWPCQRDESIR